MSNLRIVSVEKSWYRLLEVMVDKSKIGNILEIERDLLFKLYSDFFGFLKIKNKKLPHYVLCPPLDETSGLMKFALNAFRCQSSFRLSI
jgi:hypothetical protein